MLMQHSSVTEIPIPETCSLKPKSTTAYFADSFSTLIPKSDLSATQLFILTAQRIPAWVDRLMAVRNKIVKWVGLKDVGALSAPKTMSNDALNATTGQYLGPFCVVNARLEEVVVEDNDKHLHVQIALQKVPYSVEQDQMIITTVVHVHNWLGRAYMLPVGPAHKRIAPAVLRQTGAAVAQFLRQSIP